MTARGFLPHRARIAEVAVECADTRTFVLRPDPPVRELDAARPGQFVMLSVLGHAHGASTVDELTPMLKAAGFSEVAVLPTRHRNFAFLRVR